MQQWTNPFLNGEPRSVSVVRRETPSPAPRALSFQSLSAVGQLSTCIGRAPTSEKNPIADATWRDTRMNDQSVGLISRSGLRFRTMLFAAASHMQHGFGFHMDIQRMLWARSRIWYTAPLTN